MSPGLLQLSVLQHVRRTDEPRLQSVLNAAARLVTGTRRSFSNAGAPSATLAAGTPERRLQGCDARSSVAVWHFAIVPTTQRPLFASDDYVSLSQHAL